MSQTMMPPPAGVPGGPMGQAGAPPGQPNPAYAAWMQAYQQQQQVIAQNAQKQAQFDAACKLLREDGLRGFRLDIEADSTIAPDENAEQQSRIMFLKEIVPLVEQISPVAQGNPEMAEFVSQVVMFAIRGFRVARTLEEAAEKAFKVLGQMPKPPQKGAGTQKDPATEQMRIQADVHDTHVRAQTDMAETASKEAIAQQTLAQKTQQANDQMIMERDRMFAEQQHNAAQMALERERLASTERVQTARVANTEARSTTGLV